MKQQNTPPPVIQDLLFEQMATISKAHAYDILSDQVKELKSENEGLKGMYEACQGMEVIVSRKLVAAENKCRVLTEALQAFENVLIHKDGETEGNKARTNIIKHCPDMRDILNEIRNKKLLNTN